MPDRSPTVRSNLSDPHAEKKGLFIAGCRYDVILRVAMEHNFTAMAEDDAWSLCWSDVPISLERITAMKVSQILSGPNSPQFQKFNHFPGMYEICRKDRLCRNLNRLKREFPKDYNFFPATWDLPANMSELLEYGKGHKGTTYICKPDSGSQGKGIFLVNNLRLLSPFAECVCQLYIAEPFLIDGYKFDQRIYVLITCVDPLRFYIHAEGLARFATIKYQLPTEENMNVTYMHLTNYSLNKMSGALDPNSKDNGTKRPMSEIYAFMSEKGYNVQKLKDDIDDIVVKTIVGVAPSLKHSYRATFPKRDRGCFCFEVLGLDILMDRHLKPYLIEVNHSPSFNLDTNIDNEVKFPVIRDLFTIIYLGQGATPRENFDINKYNIQRRPGTNRATVIPKALKDQFAHEENSRHGWKLLFCEENPGKYAKFMHKEYFLKDDINEFLKPKLEPCMNGGWSQSFGKTPFLQSQTFLRQTAYGQKYVESTSTISSFNGNEFLKFKYNPQLSEAGRKQYNNASYSGRNNFILPPTNYISNGDLTSNHRTEPYSIQVHPSDFDRRGSSVSNNLVTSSRPSKIFSPSPRVQNTLELLRKSNVENFQAAVNDGCMSTYFLNMNSTPSVATMRAIAPRMIDNPISPYNENLHRISSKVDLSRPSTSGKNERDKNRLLELDQSKLPSIFKNAMQATQLQRKETTKVRRSNTKMCSELIPRSRSILIGNSRHFKPFQTEINAELKRVLSGEVGIELIAVGNMAQQIVEMSSTNPNQKKIS